MYRIHWEWSGWCASWCTVETKSKLVDYIINHNFDSEEKISIEFVKETLSLEKD